MVIIKELEIKNCSSIKHIFLNFENDNYVTIFNCSSTYALKHKLVRAIRLFFCKSAVKLSMEGAPNKTAYIRIKFFITKDEGKGKDVVDGMRVSTRPGVIYYYFNEGQYIDPIQAFHERCQIDVLPFYPFLKQIFSNETNDLMSQWVSSKCHLRNATEKSFDILADYLTLDSRPQSEQTRIAKLAETNFKINRDCEILNNRTFVAVANEIGRIFNYITFEEYSVNFVIPLFGKNTNFQEIKWDDMNLNELETRITKTGTTHPCVWNQLEPGLRNLLSISQKISLAKHLKQKCIYLDDTTLLQEYQNQEMIREAIIQKDGIVANADWETKNFIKRIVDVCNDNKVMIFMNYHGVLPLPPTNANIIKCRDSGDSDGQSIYVCSNLQSTTLDAFIDLFQHSITLQ